MALTTKLVMRQSQSLVMTPQLLQAIKLLQFSNLELSAFVAEELERNPLLERAEEVVEIVGPEASCDANGLSTGREYDVDEEVGTDWSPGSLAIGGGGLPESLSPETSDGFDGGQAPSGSAPVLGADGWGIRAPQFSGPASRTADEETISIESYVAAPISLKEHLQSQLALAAASASDRMTGQVLIDSIDENGYFSGSLDEIAKRLGALEPDVERILRLIQDFDPSGVGARNLAECLAIQLRERDRFDPAMQAFIGRLDLVAKSDFAALRKICNVDEDDLADMLNEIRRLDPKPGRAFGGDPVAPALPDVVVRPGADGSWLVELNTDVLPRLLVNNSYSARVGRRGEAAADRNFISTCRQSASWLTKSLEQRARTILKVSSEIVRRQDSFLARGVEHLRPLDLKTVAEAVGVHESTVSRVTSNKYVATPRGFFELKYFFTASIAARDGGDAHSAESVRFRIKQMIDQEDPSQILSDDAIVTKLKSANIDVARRTVAKYREILKIPSSVERRRIKRKGREVPKSRRLSSESANQENASQTGNDSGEERLNWCANTEPAF
jgi:RNA polymerase sigma-54 factor